MVFSYIFFIHFFLIYIYLLTFEYKIYITFFLCKTTDEEEKKWEKNNISRCCQDVEAYFKRFWKYTFSSQSCRKFSIFVSRWLLWSISAEYFWNKNKYYTTYQKKNRPPWWKSRIIKSFLFMSGGSGRENNHHRHNKFTIIPPLLHNVGYVISLINFLVKRIIVDGSARFNFGPKIVQIWWWPRYKNLENISFHNTAKNEKEKVWWIVWWN